jgi:hypothetical protein
MARAHLHPAFDGFSGTSGTMVFRRMNGETFISRRPESRKQKSSTAQQAQRDRFRDAMFYARTVLADRWQRRIYDDLAKQLDRRADKLVASDFLTPPVIDEIDATEYSRQVGGVIRVFATDDVEVVLVRIRIRTTGGTLVEEGAAAKVHGLWRYTATAVPPSGEALTITAIAKDRPGNEGSGTLVLA